MVNPDAMEQLARLELRSAKLQSRISATCTVNSPLPVLQSFSSALDGTIKECKALQNTETEIGAQLEDLIDELSDSWYRLLSFQNDHGGKDENAKLSKINFRPFDERNPLVWFQDFEVQLKANHISSEEQKFATLTGFLNSDQSLVVNPVTSKAEDPNRYASAKALLLDSYSMTRQERYDKAFTMSFNAQGESASQFLARIGILFGDDTDIDKIKAWMVTKVLPDDIRLTLLHDSSIRDSSSLVKAADVLLKSRPQSTVRSAAAVQSRQEGRTKPAEKRLCFYHQKYGAKAKQCSGTPVDPCPMFRRRASTTAAVSSNQSPAVATGSSVQSPSLLPPTSFPPPFVPLAAQGNSRGQQ